MAEGVENPHAFPFAAEYGHPAACGGMSLRDWFAGMALAGMLGHPDADYSPLGFNGVAKSPKPFAEDAYTLADAMLAARQEQRK